MAKRKQKKTSPVIKQEVKKKPRKKISPKKSFWKPNLIPIVILAVTAVLLYFQTYSYDYVLDDKIVIQDNQYTQKGIAGIKEIFTTESFQGYFGEQKDLLPGARYRPLSIASFAVEVELFKNNSVISHLINMFLYMLTGLLLFRVIGMLFPQSSKMPWYFTVAFLASLIWVLHPVHSEVVANIKGRDEILALLGALGSMYFCLSYIYWKGWYKIALSAVLFFLGLMAKENTITFLAVIPLSLHFFTKATLKDQLKLLAPLVGVTIIYLVIRYQVIGYLLNSGQEFNDIMNNPFVGMNFEEKYATIFHTLLEYLRLSFFPHPLTHDYYPFHIPTKSWSNISTLISILFLLVLLVIALLGLRKKSVYSYIILFYLATLSIVSNLFVGVGTTMNERFIYISSIAACMFLGFILSKKLYPKNTKWARPLAYGIAGVFVIFFAVKSLIRIPVWENAYTLNSAAVKVSKNSARANCFMGTAIFENYHLETDREKKQVMIDEADYYISRSVELFPKYLNANTMKAGVAAEKYKFHNDIHILLDGFKSVAIRRPDTNYLHEYFDYLNGRGRYTQELINFYYDVGKNVLHDQQKNYSWSIKYLNYAHQLDQNNVNVNRALGNSYTAVNNTSLAQKHFQLAQGNQ